MERILFWIFGVALAVLWLVLYRWAAHDSVAQGAMILATVLSATGACKCRDHKKENA